jgi:hypothetical protein
MRDATSKGTSSGILMAADADTTVSSAKVAVPIPANTIWSAKCDI